MQLFQPNMAGDLIQPDSRWVKFFKGMEITSASKAWKTILDYRDLLKKGLA